MAKDKTEVHKAKNGYSGLYNKKDGLLIFDPDGRKVFHTYNPSRYIQHQVEHFSEFTEVNG